jgi:ADP-heptose:LPS heptosyltransferase
MRVLLARFGCFGDVVLTLPIVDALHRAPGVTRVDVVTSAAYAEIFAADARVTRCHVIDDDLRDTPYDVLVDLHSSPGEEDTERVRAAVVARRRIGFAHPDRTGLTDPLPPRRAGEHAIACYLRALTSLGVTKAGSGRMALRPAELLAAAELVPVDRPVVCLVPGSRQRWRRWPAERFAALARRLTTSGHHVLVAGHTFDGDAVRRVAAASNAGAYLTSDARALAAVFGAAGVVVANNSGLLHLAAAGGARVVCLQSHLPDGMWDPWGAGHAVLTGVPGIACGCVPNDQGDLGAACAGTIPVAEVERAVLDLTSTLSVPGPKAV